MATCSVPDTFLHSWNTVNKASNHSYPQRVHIGVGGCAPNYPFLFIRHSQRPKLLQTYWRSPLSVTSLHVLHGVGLPSADSWKSQSNRKGHKMGADGWFYIYFWEFHVKGGRGEVHIKDNEMKMAEGYFRRLERTEGCQRHIGSDSCFCFFLPCLS